MHVPLRSEQTIGVTARAMEADEAEIHTTVVLSVAARVTTPTADHRLDHCQVARLHAVHSSPNFNHFTAHLVPANERIRCVRVATGIEMQITGANPGGDGAQENIPGTRSRGRPLA
jgi:hypothetical protein